MMKFIFETIIPSVYAQTQNVNLDVTLRNPLRDDINSIPLFIKALLDIAVEIGTWIAVLFIIYSGFLFIKARGNPTELESAKKTFFGTVIGTAILLGAYVIAAAIESTIRQIGAP